MKKFLATILLLSLSLASFSQDNGFFRRLKKSLTVHDTVYIYLPKPTNDTIGGGEDEDEDEGDGFEEGIPIPIDTLDTKDKFCKVVLFDNSTWLYYNIEKPVIPDSLDSDYWVTEQVHSYKDIALKDLPEEVDILLVDSAHGYCIPHPGPVTSRYKYRWRRAHKGVDIGLDEGDAIYAAFDGVVRAALPSRMTGGYGNVLVIRHVNGLETYYGHLSDYVVESGDIVKAGELIGYGGNTGRSTGPHLHFETRYMGQAFDPERIFDLEKGTLRSEIFTLKKHYFNINSHYGMSDRQSLEASKKKEKPKTTSKSKSKAPVYYKVKKGDTLSKIASRNKTTVPNLCKLNKISAKKPLKVGQRIRVK